MATYRLFSGIDGPGTQTSDTEQYTMGVEFYVTQSGCTLTQIHFWASATVTGSNHAARLYQVGNTTPVTGSLKALPTPLVAGWNTVTLDAPIALTANTRYRACVFFTTDNGYTATSLYWSTGSGSSGITSGPLAAPNSTNATNALQCSFAVADIFPASAFNATNYWLDVTIDDGVPAGPSVGAGADVTAHTVSTQFSRTATETNLTGVTARAWTIEAGPAGVGSTIGTAAALTWTPSTTGTYTLRYSATHSAGTSTDDVGITVVNPQPTLVADRGSAQNITAQTSTGVTLTSPTSIATGNYLIARVAVDNSGTNGAAPGCTVTDPRSNTWTVLGPALVDPGAAAAGATAYIAYAKVVTAYQAADALTFNWGGVSTTAKAVVVEEWANIHDASPVAVTETTATGTASSALSIAITPTAADQLVYTCLAVEGPTGDTAPTDADTTNGSWVALTRLSTASGTATSNQTVSGGYKQVTASGAQTWNATITARDWAALAVVFAPPAAAVSQTVTPAVAQASGDAPDPTARDAVAAVAGTGQATGAAPVASAATTASQTVTPAVAQAAGAAPTTATVPASIATAGTGQAAGSAANAVTSTASQATASAAVAASTGAVPAAGVSAVVGAIGATGTGAAPTVTTAAVAATTASAQTANATGDAPDPTVSSVATATGGPATVSGDAPDPTARTALSAVATTASATGDAPDATAGATTPPTVTAGRARPVAVGAGVLLDVTATPPGGQTIAGYSWSVISGGGSLTNATSATPTWTAPASGSGLATIRATVSASGGGFATADVTASYHANIVAAENALTGTARATWDLATTGTEIAGISTLQGFADGFTFNRDETVNFKIAQSDGAGWSAQVYRLGYYGGNGARDYGTLTPTGTQLTNSQAQPTSLDADPNTTLKSSDCSNWSTTLTWTPPAWAPSGIYALKLNRTGGGASQVLFVLRDDARAADLMFMPADSTWNAYNAFRDMGSTNWLAGNSLYFGIAVDQYNADCARFVSYDRPFMNRAALTGGYGAVQYSTFFTSEYGMLRFLERNGIDVKYYGCIDAAGDATGTHLIGNGSTRGRVKTGIFVGHNEYWSTGMRSGWEAAKAAGVNIFSCAANEVFWRLVGSNNDSNGRPRTWECFKSTIAARASTGRTEWTGTWRDPDGAGKGGNNPENTFTGTIFVTNGPDLRSLAVPFSGGYSAQPLWRHTSVASLTTGQSYTSPAEIVGFEWDTYGPAGTDNAAAAACLAPPHPRARYCSTATYNTSAQLQDAGDVYGTGNNTHRLVVHPNGGGNGGITFGTGTVNWAWGVDNANAYQISVDRTDIVLQQATVNILTDMGAPAATLMGTLTAPTPVTWFADYPAGTAGGTAVALPAGVSVTVTTTLANAAGSAFNAVPGNGTPWGAPIGLQATVVSTSQVDLSWVPVIGALGYDIERNGVVIATDVIGTGYSDSGLTPNTTYTYRTRAVR